MISSFFILFNNKVYYFDNNATTLIYDKEVYNKGFYIKDLD